MIHTALQAMGPSVEDCISKLMGRDFTQEPVCLKFKCVQVWKSDTTQLLLQFGEQEVVIWGQIWAVRRVIKYTDVSPANPVLGNVTGMRRSVVMVQDKHATPPQLCPSVLNGSEQPVQNLDINQACDCLIMDKFTVHNALVVKKCYEHALGVVCTPSLQWFLWSWCILVQPSFAPFFGLWGVQVNVTLISSDHFPHQIWLCLYPVQSILGTTNSDTPLDISSIRALYLVHTSCFFFIFCQKFV